MHIDADATIPSSPGQDIAIRLARDSDLPRIVKIYNHEVLHGSATFDTEPVDVASRRVWLQAHQPPRHPAIVADDGGLVRGFACLSAWSDRCAYARAAEVSLYVDTDARGQGLGRALLRALIERGKNAGLGVLIARICVESIPSLRLHESLGFQHIGSMRRVGQKFGRILDIELYDLHIDGAGLPDEPSPSPALTGSAE